MSILSPLAYALGKPIAQGKVKATPQDFKVSEDLGFEFAHQGEHLMVRVRKTGDNTRYVANELAKACGVPSKNVSWAGLKDRHAVTEQWLSVQAPKQEFDIKAFEAGNPTIQILKTDKHTHKLKPGDLQGNHFEIRLVDVSTIDDVVQRLETIKQQGVPNYFGAQRFGNEGNNVTEARRWGRDNVRTRDQAKRSMYLSAARSWIFNQIVSQRIEQNAFNQLVLGDLILEEQQNQLVDAQNQADLQSKLEKNQIELTAALAGDNALPTQAKALEIELAQLDAEPDLMALIRGNRMRHDRRAIHLKAQELTWQVDQEAKAITLNFYLPTGCFATAILRELINEIEFERTFTLHT